MNHESQINMSKANSAKEVLIAAKWIIENVGWCQRSSAKDIDGLTVIDFLNVPGHCYCAYGAATVVDTDDIHRREAMRLVSKNIPDTTGVVVWNIINFNDDSKTTKEKVIKAFDKAIASLP